MATTTTTATATAALPLCSSTFYHLPLANIINTLGMSVNYDASVIFQSIGALPNGNYKWYCDSITQKLNTY